MMKMSNSKIWMAVVAVTTVMTISSCRNTSDDVMSYGQNDKLAFAAADTSFVAQFDALWTALNSNYGIWDYEAKLGLDWDAVYKKYMPKMQELDERDKEKTPVSDEDFLKLYEEILGPLHDGHLSIQVKNIHTGNRLTVSPSDMRNASRPDYHILEVPSLNYYYTQAAGQNQATEYIDASVRPGRFIYKEIDEAIDTLNQLIAPLEAIADRTDLQDYFLDKYCAAREELSSFTLRSMADLDYYNNVLTTKYRELDITLEPFDLTETTSWIDVKYANFDDGILYFGLTGFHLIPYLINMYANSPCGEYYTSRVYTAWDRWLTMIQEYHNANRLKGVIIDLRNNDGGFTADYQYLLGALLPSGGHRVGLARFKTGVGRYDYSPLTPQELNTYSGDHVTVTEPIVVLANCHSISMAEVTCLGAKQLDNACVIGTRTWGGMCLLSPTPSYYSEYYASVVGVKDETPFWAYIPANVTISDEGILEGIGVTPDIEVQLDMNLYETTGRDSQLERALDYIRTER